MMRTLAIVVAVLVASTANATPVDGDERLTTAHNIERDIKAKRVRLAWGGATTITAPPFQGGTITGGITFSNVATDITTGANEDLTITPNGSGALVVDEGNATPTLKLQHSGNAATFKYIPNFLSIVNNGAGGTAEIAAVGTVAIGYVGSPSASTLIGSFNTGMTTSSLGTTQFSVYGNGMVTTAAPQTPSACSTSASIDPQAAVVVMDAGASSCSLTVTTTTAAAINQEGWTVRITSKNTGPLKIASTNFASIPSRCTTTGLAAGQSALIAWSKDQSKWTFLGGCE